MYIHHKALNKHKQSTTFTTDSNYHLLLLNSVAVRVLVMNFSRPISSFLIPSSPLSPPMIPVRLDTVAGLVSDLFPALDVATLALKRSMSACCSVRLSPWIVYHHIKLAPTLPPLYPHLLSPFLSVFLSLSVSLSLSVTLSLSLFLLLSLSLSLFLLLSLSLSLFLLSVLSPLPSPVFLSLLSSLFLSLPPCTR